MAAAKPDAPAGSTAAERQMSPGPDAPAGGPNVVVVLADDMGWGDLGCYGGAIPTPNIDRLADEGVRLTDCHSASAVCTPSRYALLTGRYAWRGPLKNFVLMGHGPAIVEPKRPTLASVLRSSGYTTGFFGKWHLGLGWQHRDGPLARPAPPTTQAAPPQRDGPMTRPAPPTTQAPPPQRDGSMTRPVPPTTQAAPPQRDGPMTRPVPPTTQAAPPQRDGSMTRPVPPTTQAAPPQRDGSVRDAFAPGAVLHDDVATDRGESIDYTQPFTGGPTSLGFDRFFGIAGSLDMPPYCYLDGDRVASVPSREKTEFLCEQRPGYVAEDFREDEVDVRFTEEAVRFIAGADDVPFLCYLAPSAPHRPNVPPEFIRGRSGLGDRADGVCLVDWAVGQVLDALEAAGVVENTIVIVTSDNGAPMIFTDDGDVTAHSPNGDWRGQKGDLWDGGHREPFIARWPGVLPPGEVRDEPVCLTDVLPTVAAATGAGLPGGAAEDGMNVLDLLRGTAADYPTDRPIVHHSLAGRFSLRRGPWKAIFSSGAGGGFSEPSITSLFKSGSGKAHVSMPWDADHPDGQLYDIAADPYEKVNLWHDEPDVVAELYADLQKICGDESSGLPFDVLLHYQ